MEEMGSRGGDGRRRSRLFRRRRWRRWVGEEEIGGGGGDRRTVFRRRRWRRLVVEEEMGGGGEKIGGGECLGGGDGGDG